MHETALSAAKRARERKKEILFTQASQYREKVKEKGKYALTPPKDADDEALAGGDAGDDT